MMSCKEASRLVSEMRDHRLPIRKQIGLWLHLAACRVCSAYKRQLEVIGRISRAAGEMVTANRDGPSLSEQSRQRMKHRLMHH